MTTLVSDVVEHSELDLDVLDMETNVDLLTTAGMTAAYTAYSEGGNRRVEEQGARGSKRWSSGLAFLLPRLLCSSSGCVKHSEPAVRSSRLCLACTNAPI